MRGVVRGVGRAAAFVAFVTTLAAPAAFAFERDECDRGFKFFERAKRFVVTVFSRVGGPPG